MFLVRWITLRCSPQENGCCSNHCFQIRSRPLQISTDNPLRTLVIMESIETFHNKKMIAAQTVGFIFEVDFFKSVQMIRSFGCHGQHWDVSQLENGSCRNLWFQIRSKPLQINTDYHRFWVSWTTLRRFTIRKRLLQQPLISDSRQTSSNQCRWS